MSGIIRPAKNLSVGCAMKKMIVAMSTSCLGYLDDKPKDVAILPLNIQVAGSNYVEHETIDTSYLHRKLSENPSLQVGSSPPHEGQILELFYELFRRGVNEILVIAPSSKLSEAYQRICSVQGIFGERLKIHPFDSRTIGHGEALLAYEASRMLAQDKDFTDIITRLENMRSKMRMFVIIDNLRTMIRTKRISAPAGFFATLLDIKPIIFVAPSGEFVPHEKIRHFENSLYRMVESILEAGAAGKKGVFYIAVHEDNPYMGVLHKILAEFGIKDAVKVPVSSASAINGGINGIGMVFMEEERVF